jgi:DinB superfamily
MLHFYLDEWLGNRKLAVWAAVVPGYRIGRGEGASRPNEEAAPGSQFWYSRSFCFAYQDNEEETRKMKSKSLAGVLIAFVLMAGAAAARAQEVTQADKERALQYLETTKKNVLEATKGLSEAQWNFKPAPDRWSVAQVVEHIATAEDFLLTLDKEKVMISPAGDEGRDVKKTDDAVLAMVPDRSHKAQAPEPLVPTNRFGSPEASLKHFVESRATTQDFLKTTAGLRDHVMDSPLGKLDGYEFVLFIAAHSERHTKQINEVKADPNFPKK